MMAAPNRQPRFERHVVIKAVALAWLICLSFSSATQADTTPTWPPQLTLTHPPLPLIGQGVATYLWFDVYDAALYAPEGTSGKSILSPKTPKALVLHYQHAVTVKDIDKASWQTLNEQLSPAERLAIKPKIDALQASMRDVKPGDRYTLIWQPAGSGHTAELTLRFNQKIVFRSPDAALSRAYFGIWLGEPPLSNKLKKSLLGG